MSLTILMFEEKITYKSKDLQFLIMNKNILNTFKSLFFCFIFFIPNNYKNRKCSFSNI